MNKVRLISTAVALAGLALGTTAMAQSTWNVYKQQSGDVNGGSHCTQSTTNSGTFNNSWNCASVTGGTGGSAMTASAWSTDRGSNGNFLSGSGFASAYMSSQGKSGFGAASRTEGLGAQSPDHSFDSISPGTMDAMLLDFGNTSVILDKIGIGWTNGDADITVMRWRGSSAPDRKNGTSTLVGDGEQNLSSNLWNSANPTVGGWELVGSYANLGTDAGLPFGGAARSTNTTLSSSWWLISTFNTTLNGGSRDCKKEDGSTTQCIGTDLIGNDSFKLNYITTKLGGGGGGGGGGGSVPEPTSLALATLALAGLMGARRRVNKRA